MSTFRKALKAVGGYDKDAKYSYEVIEFYDDGTFMKKTVKMSETHMRMDDPTKSQFETRTGQGFRKDSDNWKLISEEDFRIRKNDWDEIRSTSKKTAVDDDGFLVNANWIHKLIKVQSDFTGTDEIGKFWVVTRPKDSTYEPDDIRFESDIFSMINLFRDGLAKEDILLITKDTNKADEYAEKLIKDMSK